nr:hypothetical protein [Evansella caseinilytica]
MKEIKETLNVVIKLNKAEERHGAKQIRVCFARNYRSVITTVCASKNKT